jgi:hypothetical protein
MTLADNVNDPIYEIAHFDEVAFWFLTSSSLLAPPGLRYCALKGVASNLVPTAAICQRTLRVTTLCDLR